MAQESSSVTDADLTARFEARAKFLEHQAYGFLGMIFVLLAFGGYVVFQASALTNRDVNVVNIGDRISATQAEISELQQKNEDINNVYRRLLKDCPAIYHKFFDQWAKENLSKPESGAFYPVAFRRLPDGKQIADGIEKALASDELSGQNIIGLQINFGFCGGPETFLIFPREQYGRLISALREHSFNIEVTKINALADEAAENFKRQQFLGEVVNTLHGREVAWAANVGLVADTTPDDEHSLMLRLIQTSITRFGILAVVSILVGVLIPLYRYNIRLAAFYYARADALLFMQVGVRRAGFEGFAGALTPRLEFGKNSGAPVDELSEMVRTVKRFEKGTDDPP